SSHRSSRSCGRRIRSHAGGGPHGEEKIEKRREEKRGGAEGRRGGRRERGGSCLRGFESPGTCNPEVATSPAPSLRASAFPLPDLHTPQSAHDQPPHGSCTRSTPPGASSNSLTTSQGATP